MRRLPPVRIVTILAASALTGACSDLNPPPAVAPPIVTSALPAPAFDRGGREKVPFLPGEVLVRYKEGADPQAVAAKHRGKKLRGLSGPRAEVLSVPQGEEEAVAAALAADPDVELAEVNELIAIVPCEVGLCAEPTDAFNSRYKWDLNNSGAITHNGTGQLQPTGKADADVDWVEVYDALGGNAFTGSAVIGILDSGIRPTHLETSGRIIAAKNFATGYPDTLIIDRDGHGTHVATIAAGRANGAGTTGIAYGANIKLVNAKICERYLFPDGIVRTSCPTSSQVDAIYWAVAQGANVLNLSIGGSPLATSGSPFVEAALNYAVSQNVLPVCAAGNDNYPNTAFPARFAACMSVAATNWSDLRAGYSNYSGDVEVSAPGGDGNPTGSASSLIMAASNSADNTYTWKAGTSMAAPQVAGLAALMYAAGMTDMAEVRERIKATADPLPGTTGMGTGRINVYRAVTGKDPDAPPVAVVQPVAGAVEGSAYQFSSAGSLDPNNHPISFLWTFGDGATSTAANPAHSYADNGTYSVSLTVTDESNRATTMLSTAVVGNANPAASASAVASTIMSGEAGAISGTFSDAGAADGPWTLAVNWGNGSAGASLATQGSFTSESAPYCAPGAYPVAVTITDKDGGAGNASTSITVNAHVVAVSAPAPFNNGEKGSYPVTILGRAGFTGTDLDVSSLRIGGAPVQKRVNGTYMAAVSDENGDGVLDLVVHVERAHIVPAAGAIVVTGVLTGGCVAVAGSHPIR